MARKTAAEHFKTTLSRPDEDDEEVRAAMEREDLEWRPALAFIGKLLWRHPLLVISTMVLGLALAVAELVSIGLIFPFLDGLTGGGGESLTSQTRLAFLVPYFESFSLTTKIQLIAVGFFVIQLFKGLLGYITGRVTSYQKILLDRDLRSDLFDQILRVDMRFINKDKVANLYTILHDYATDVASSASKVLKGIPKAASLLGLIVAMILLSWELTLVALVFALVATRAVNGLTNVVRRMSKRVNVYRVRLKHVSLEALNGLKLVHLFAREDHARDRFQHRLANYQDDRYRRASIRAVIAPFYQTLMMGMFAIVLIAGTLVLDTAAGTWLPILTVFVIVLTRLTGPTARYAATKTQIASNLPSLHEIIRFLSLDERSFMEDGDRPFDGLQEAVRFEEVFFRYDEDEPMVLQGVSFEVPKGTTVALVGSSGAGKSTLVDLLARLYDPVGGRITADGIDVRELKVETWRRRLAVVSQDSFLFNDTVIENIRFGRLDATDEEVFEAARQANAHHFIEGLPNGYQTELGERGVRLSGGQAQRLAIARAIVADPDVLILDEATSALDTETERQVQQALDRVAQDRTVVAIAHRLSTIRDADEIIVLEAGAVVERGTHDELLARRGHYWRYVHMQDLLSPQPAPAAAGGDTGNGERGGVRLVLGPEPGRAQLMSNGSTLGGVELYATSDDEVAGELLDHLGDAVAVLDPTGQTASVRLDGFIGEDVPVVAGDS